MAHSCAAGSSSSSSAASATTAAASSASAIGIGAPRSILAALARTLRGKRVVWPTWSVLLVGVQRWRPLKALLALLALALWAALYYAVTTALVEREYTERRPRNE